MTEFVRRLVSGGKARFKDPNLDLELGMHHLANAYLVVQCSRHVRT